PVQQCVLDRGGSTPGGQQRKVQVDPPVLWDVEGGPRQQGTVGDHRAAVRGDFGQALEKLRVLGLDRFEYFDAFALGQFGHRGGRDLASASGTCVRSGHHGGDLVVGCKECLQRGHRHLGCSGKDELHVGVSSTRGHSLSCPSFISGSHECLCACAYRRGRRHCRIPLVNQRG